MSIDFRCPDCNKKLRTSDNRAGARASCPDCGAEVTVPSPSSRQYENDEYPSFSDRQRCPVCGNSEGHRATSCSSCGELFSQSRSNYSNENREYATFWIRFLAFFIDRVIIGVPLFVFGMVMAFVMISAGIDPEEPAIQLPLRLVEVLVGWIYFALMESSSKQATFGKMAVGIIVTDEEGDRISFGNATGRYFGKIISALFCLLGFIWAAFDENKQAWHDKIAHTLVLKKR